MIGLFINTVPVRVQVQDEEEVGVWLTRLQEQQLEQQHYEYSSLAQVQSWCRSHRSEANPDPTDPDRIPHEQELFESLLVFENYPVQSALAERQPAGLSYRLGVAMGLATVEAVQVVEQTNYPL